MQKFEVLIEENAFGGVRPVEVVADAPLAALVPAIVDELNLPKTDLFGRQLVYTLRPATAGRALPQHTTLVASGIAPGSRLALEPYVVGEAAAPVARYGRPNTSPLHHGSPAIQGDPALYSAPTMADFSAMPAVSRGNTSGHLPALKGERKGTRRAFLVLCGIALGVGGSGVGYAAYQEWTAGAFDGLFNGGTANNGTLMQQVAPQQPTQARAITPTMARSMLVFTQHRAMVRAVGWSPGGTILASGGDDERLLVWSTDGGVRQDIQHPGSVRTLAWSPEGQRLVTGSNNQVTFFNAGTGQVLARSTHRHNAQVTSLAWAAHGQMEVVSGSADTRAIVWNTTNYGAQTVFIRHTTAISSVGWSPDGQSVASASQGGVIRVWSAVDGQELHGFYQDAAIPMRALAFAPAGGQLAVGGDDGKVRIWDGLVCRLPENGLFGTLCADVPQRLTASNGVVRSLVWSPDGRFLAVGADDGLSVWYPAQDRNRPLLTIQQQESVRSLAWSPDGKQLAAATGNSVTLWGLM